MIKIKGRFLPFDKVNANGSVISKDCKINYPEKVPIIWDFKPTIQNVIGDANIVKEENGLYFDGELLDQDITKVIQKESANLGVGGFYTGVIRNDNKIITDVNIHYISITPRPALPDYTFEVIESEDENE